MKCNGLAAPDPSLGDAKLVIKPSSTGLCTRTRTDERVHVYTVRHVRQPHPALTRKVTAVKVQAPSYSRQVPITQQPHASSGHHSGQQLMGVGVNTGHQQGLRKEGECLEFWWVPAPCPSPQILGLSEDSLPHPSSCRHLRGGHQLVVPSLGPALGVDMVWTMPPTLKLTGTLCAGSWTLDPSIITKFKVAGLQD